jgi:hypothetical protein
MNEFTTKSRGYQFATSYKATVLYKVMDIS